MKTNVTLLIRSSFLVSFSVFAILSGISAFAAETTLVLRVEPGKVSEAVAAYRTQYHPSTQHGLSMLRQLAIQVLWLGLQDSAPNERNVVAGILGRWGDQAALWVLEDAIHSNKPMVRRTAADALGDMATPGAVCVLRRLYDTDEEGKRLALSGLRRTRDKTALLYYLDALESEDNNLRIQGIGGLREMRIPTLMPALRAVLEQEKEPQKDPMVALLVAQSLAISGDSAGFAYLADKLTDKREHVRDAVAGLLGSVRDKRVETLLRTTLAKDPGITVRTTAAASLTRFQDASGLPLVQEALTDIDFRVRLAAAISFSRMDYTIARPVILSALGSRDPLVRTHVYKVIGENEDGQAATVVTEAVGQEQDRYAQAQALWTLGRIGGREAIGTALDYLPDNREEVRHASAEALVMISDRFLQDSGLSVE